MSTLWEATGVSVMTASSPAPLEQSVSTTGKASVTWRPCRPCASSRPQTETVSPSLSAAVMEAEGGGHSANFAPSLAPSSTRRCARSDQATPLMGETLMSA